MELFDRVSRLLRSNLRSWLDQPEDPELLLEQQVENLQQDLIRLRQAVAAAIATQKRCERQFQQALALAEQWQHRAHIALQRGDEVLARSALAHRQPHLEQVRVLQGQLDHQRRTILELKRNMRALEIKVAEARARKDLFVARARAAEAGRNLHQLLRQVNVNDPASAFERMAEKVDQLEAEAAAIADLDASDALEQKFLALERNDEIETQLKRPPNPQGDRSHPL